MTTFVLFNPNRTESRRTYVSRSYGQGGGYTRSFTDNRSTARTWKTRHGVERFLERYPGLSDFYEIRELSEGQA